MKNLSPKTVLWIIFGFIAGYFAGQIVGGLLGAILWAFVGVFYGGFAYQATSTIIINTILSIAFGVLLSYLAWSFDKRLFGSKLSFLIWGLAGIIAGLIVMFTYGIDIISDPETYRNYNGLAPLSGEILHINRLYEPLQSPSFLSTMRYGGGTGQLVGIYVGIFAGLLISVRETLGRKRTAEDKQEFDEYSKFFDEQLKK